MRQRQTIRKPEASMRHSSRPTRHMPLDARPAGYRSRDPQDILGNHGFLRRSAGVVQTKLTVGKPNDQFEREADRVADQVMRMPGDMRDSGTGVFAPSNHSLQRKCACGGTPGPSGECEECSKKKRLDLQTRLQVNEPGDIYAEAEKINNIRSSSPRLLISHPSDRSEREADRVAHEVVRKPANSLGKLISRVSVQPMVSAKAQSRNHLSNSKDGAASDQSSEVSPQTEAQVRSAVGSGCPLPVPLRDFFDHRLDHDFSHVRIHTDQTAAETSQSLNAAAFTFGSDVFFNAGHFNPHTAPGVGLIAHELTHVAQQSADGISRQLIQRDKLPYRQVAWGDFTGAIPANITSEGAGIWSSFGVPSSATFSPSVKPTKTKCKLAHPVKGQPKRDVIWEGTGQVDPAQFDSDFQAYMDTARSWVLANIKDNGASFCAGQVARCERDFTQNPRSDIRFGSARATSKADCRRRIQPACLSKEKRESDRLLAHEQWHFEITKVMSEKARTSFKAAAAAMNFISRECGPKAAMDKLENDVDQPRKDLIAQGGAWVTLMNTIQDEYDLRTTHSMNTAKQQEWEGKIQAGLVDYNLAGAAATPPATTPTPPANPPATPAPTPQRARPAPAPPPTTK